MTCKALKNRADYDILDSLDIDELIAMKKRKKYLDKHPYAIWQSKDGKYWYTTFPDPTKERGVRQIRRQSREELDEAIAEFWENAEVESIKKTVGEVYDEWTSNRIEMKRIVQATNINNRAVFRKHFADIVDRPMADVKPIEWCDFLEKELVKHNLTKVEFGTLKSILLGMVKWAYKRGDIQYSSSSITDLLDIPEKAYRENRKTDDEEVYSEKETPIIIDYLVKNQDLINLGLLLMFVTGIRIGELLSLKHGDFGDGIVRIRRTISTTVDERGMICRRVKDEPKTFAGIRDVYVPETYDWLVKHFAEGDPEAYIFLTKRGNFVKYDTVNLRLEKICKQLGIPFRSTHKIRKTYGSILLDSGVDKRFVIQQMGHNDISCTENYYHRDRKDGDKKFEILGSIEAFRSPTSHT